MKNRKIGTVLKGILIITIGAVALAGCGKKPQVGEQVEKVMKGREALLQADNINLTREIISETEGESIQYRDDVTVDNKTKDWYGSNSNVIEGKSVIFSESLVSGGELYRKVSESSKWERLEDNIFKTAYGLDTFQELDLKVEDCKKLKTSKKDGKEVITVIPTEECIKRLNEKNIKDMETQIEAYENSPYATPEAIENNRASLEAYKQTDYKQVEYSFVLDKAGVLVGYTGSLVIAQPQKVLGSDGKFVLTQEKKELKMTTNIVVNSFNDEKNEEFINKLKGEL